MTLILRLRKTGGARGLFHWLLRHVDYPFSEGDGFLTLPGTPPSIVVFLADPQLNEAVAQRERESLFQATVLTERDWQGLSRKTKPRDLASFLQTVRPTPQFSEPRGAELLVAGYGTGNDLPELLDAVPRTSKQTQRALVVAGTNQGAAPGPRVLVTIPEVAADRDWQAWCADMKRQFPEWTLQLFRRLAGSLTGEFYLELGFSHPFERDLGRLYPAGDGRVFLIHGSAKGWTILKPGDVQAEVLLETPVPGAHIELDEAATVVEHTVEPAPPDDGPKWPLRLRTKHDARIERLRSVEGRIQSVRDELLGLEDERMWLLDRHRERFRFVLRFEQAAGPQGQPTALAPGFERFLSLARRQLGKIKYGFVPATGERTVRRGKRILGDHLLCTPEPVWYHDLPLSLADEVFYQPTLWRDWNLQVFVADRCDLQPRIDQKWLADSLEKVLDEAGRQPDHYALLHAGAGGKLQIEAFPEAQFAPIAQRLQFLNTQFQAASAQLLQEAEAELKQALQTQKQNLIDHIEALEVELCADADQRLQVAQRRWNAIVPRIEGVVALAAKAGGQFDELEEMLNASATTWKQVLEHLIQVQERLVAGKIKALKELNDWSPVLQKRIEDTQPANRDTQLRLSRLEAILGQRETEAQSVLRDAEREFQKADDTYRAFRTRIDPLLARSQKLADDGEQLRQKVKELRDEQRTRVERAEELVEAIDELATELRALVASFEAHLQRIAGGHKDLVDLTKRLGALDGQTRAHTESWEREAQVAARETAQVEASVGVAEFAVRGFQERVQAAHDEARARLAQLRARCVQNEAEVQKLSAELARCHDATRELRAAHQRIQQLEADVERARSAGAQARDELQGAARALQDLVAQHDAATRSQIDTLTGELRRFVADIELLAEVERRIAALCDAPEQARQLATFARDADLTVLDPRQHARVWSGNSNHQDTGDS